MKISEVINTWRFSWLSDRRACCSKEEYDSRFEDLYWENYVNSLSNFELLENLKRYGDEE